ncbi:MAG TPA: GIY-YIG nuclease family protein [Clostridia bacterium]|nr:GIY-YIG nuclease family protein [Clostridia bacterium]
MSQRLLFPDPRPLIERLGADFFRQAPQTAGVYLMRDAADTVLYVGKAKNLRQRLASYRVANPDRLGRRHLRLLSAVERIELQPCADEAAALSRESGLLRSLRPRFNRAGTWPGPLRYFLWKLTEDGLSLVVQESADPAWHCHGPFNSGILHLRAALVRLLWCATHPERGLAQLPPGWFHGRMGRATVVPRDGAGEPVLAEAATCLAALFAGSTEPLTAWITERTGAQTHPFVTAVREADLEAVKEFKVPAVSRGSMAAGSEWEQRRDAAAT